jgi:hypothetical protein
MQVLNFSRLNQEEKYLDLDSNVDSLSLHLQNFHKTALALSNSTQTIQSIRIIVVETLALINLQKSISFCP